MTEQQIKQTVTLFPAVLELIIATARDVLKIQKRNSLLTYEDFDLSDGRVEVTFREYIYGDYETEFVSFPVEYLWTDFEEHERIRFEEEQKRLKETAEAKKQAEQALRAAKQRERDLQEYVRLKLLFEPVVQQGNVKEMNCKELDKKLCEKLKIAGSEFWCVGNEESICFRGTETRCREWVMDHPFNCVSQGFSTQKKIVYPDLSTTGAGMFTLMSAIRAKGWWCRITQSVATAYAEVEHMGGLYERSAPDAPMALALAVLDALFQELTFSQFHVNVEK